MEAIRAYTITHCSTYFFSAEFIEGVEQDKASLSDVTINVADLTDEQADIVLRDMGVKTGDEKSGNVMPTVILAFVAWAAVLVAVRSTKKENSSKKQ